MSEILSGITLEQLIDTALLRSGFNSAVVLTGTTLLGVSAGLAGTFSLLRKRALMGDALAHSTLPGLALAFLFSVFYGDGSKSLFPLLLGASATAILGVLCVQFLVHNTRLGEEAAIGAVLSVFFGIGVVLLSLIQNLDSGSAGGLSHFIYGQTAAMSRQDAGLLALVAAGACFASVMLFKEFGMVCFDTEFARTQGWPVTFIDLLMMAQIVLVTVLGLQFVGVILIVSLLIIPAAAARFWTERLSRMLAISALIGGASGYVGALLSSLFPHAPAGSLIVLTAGALFLLSFLFAPERGVFVSVFRSLALRLRVSEEHLLRSFYEYLELHGGECSEIPHKSIWLMRGWSRMFQSGLLSLLRMKGFLSETSKSASTLSEEGYSRAAELTRNHRLWEEYLLQYGSVDVSHVDYSADFVEHVLSPRIVNELESHIETQGTLESPHPIEAPLTSLTSEERD